MSVGFVADAAETVPASGQLTSADVEVFAGIDPVRLLDTRSGIGAPTAGPFGPGETRTLVAAGFEGIPADATSIAINVTLPRSASTTSFVTVWPSGTPQPDTSTNNATPGQAVPNFTVTALGANGGIDVFNEAGDTNIVIDVVGYYVAMSSVEAAASPGGELFSGLGAPLDAMGEDGDFYIDQLTVNIYMKEQADWGVPMIELQADEPHVIAADGPPVASLGDEGDVYFDTGALEFYGPKVANSWGAGQPVGPDGVGTGDGGSSFLSGNGAPAGSLGAAGDLYLDAQNTVLYGPKTAGGWGAGVDVGPDGVGSTLLTGSGAPSGDDDGVDGDTYIDVDTSNFYGPKTDGSWPAPLQLRGEDGLDGLDGATIRSGAGAPDPDFGDDGDVYVDTDNGDLYGPKTTDDGWGSPVSLRGADGADGEDGVDGSAGGVLTTDGIPDVDGDEEIGDVAIDETTGDIYRFDGTVWVLVGSTVSPRAGGSVADSDVVIDVPLLTLLTSPADGEIVGTVADLPVGTYDASATVDFRIEGGGLLAAGVGLQVRCAWDNALDRIYTTSLTAGVEIDILVLDLDLPGVATGSVTVPGTLEGGVDANLVCDAGSTVTFNSDIDVRSVDISAERVGADVGTVTL